MTPTIEPIDEEIRLDKIRLEGNSSITNLDIIRDDISLMFKFAVNTGKELPSNLSLVPNETSYTNLISDYNSLLKLIAPVTPESILYLNAELTNVGKDGKWYLIPIFTKCIVLAAIALVAMIAVSMHPEVNELNQNSGLLDSNGHILLLNLGFICAASLLGVMFYLLKTIGDKIKNSTLLPHDSIELNAAIIIGVISGFVITELFTLNSSTIDNNFLVIHKMTLALLGGFSSDAIFSIMQGIVNKFRGMFISTT